MRTNLLLQLLLLSHFGHSQDAGTVTGKVIDKEMNQLLGGATVSVKGGNMSTSTTERGEFILRNLSAERMVLEVSHVGYERVTLPVVVRGGKPTVITVFLNIETRVGNEVVVSASKRSEKITNAPASIQVIGKKQLEQFAGSNVTELFSRVQGIEYTRSGVDEITMNARGLNSAFNYKVFQMVDGRNSMASASAGLALFNNGSTNKDDIERIEILLGPQSALYGPNAHNGLVNYITKDPRKYPGTSISASAGSQNQFSTRFRHALKINNKWAYKLTGEHASGKDYEWYDTVYAGGAPYGSEAHIPERIKDFSFERYRGEAHVFFSVMPKADIIVSGGGSEFTRLQVTTSGRNQLRGVTYGFVQARFIHPRFFANVYNTWGNLGKTLLIGGYTRDYWNRIHSTLPPTSPVRGRLSPDAAELVTTSANTVIEKSHRLNAEVQYNYLFKKAGVSFVTGLTYQLDRPNGYGISLIDSFQKISISQYGAVVQLDKSLPWNMRFIAATRYDHHSNFGGFVAPRLALLKKVGEGSVRFTWGTAYSMPTIQNQYAGVNRYLFGNATGIYYIPDGANVQNVESYVTTTPLQPERVSTWEVGFKGNVTKKLYVDINCYDGVSKNFISPARTKEGRVLKVNGISVTHNPFFAGSEDSSNHTLNGASFLTFFNYGAVRSYGIDAGVTYAFNKYISFAVRYSCFGSDITKDNPKNDANGDGHVLRDERSLNAPKNRAVGILSFQNLLKAKMYFTLCARYVEQYDFYSGNQIGTAAGKGKRGILVPPAGKAILKNFDWGPLGGFTTLDIETGYRFNQWVMVNAGVTNLLDSRQVEMVGSPSIGRLLMVELKLQVP